MCTSASGVRSLSSSCAPRCCSSTADGVLLDPPSQAQFTFPVLSGVREDETDERRRERVRAMLQVQDELGYLAKDVSEVNVARSREHPHRRAGAAARHRTDSGRDANFASALPELSQPLPGDPETVSGGEDVRSAVGRSDHGKGLGPEMAVKPLYGVGLDAGSRKTRMVICGLDGGQLRLLGCGAVPSQGWKKGRIADQTAVAESIRAALREAEAAAGVSAEAAVVGMGGYMVRGANGTRRHRSGTRARDRAARRQPGGGPRLQRAAPGRPHGAADVPAGFRGGRSPRPSRLE